MSLDRPRRADAVRNRGKILSAARVQIGARGTDAGMVEIAMAAGVAVGTLYRHFPTKDDLVAAVMAAHVSDVADDAEASLARASGGVRAVDEVVGFLTRVAEASAQVQAVKAAAARAGALGSEPTADEVRAGTAVADLLSLAQQAGDVRAAVTTADLYLLLASAPLDQPRQVRERWLELILTGILSAG